MQLQFNLFEITSLRTEIERGDAVIVHKMISGRNGQEAKVKSIVEDSGERKFLIQFSNGVEFWTNEPAVKLNHELCN